MRADLSPQAVPSPRPAYLPHLDGLRAVAVLLVLLAHFPPLSESGWALALWRLAEAAKVGVFGVDLFFVLSGFLITRLLLAERGRTGSIDLGRFYARRSLRIFPIYFLCVLGVVMVFGIDRDLLAALLTYTINYVHVVRPVPFPLEHAWSLAVEEQFYLVWPFVLLPLPQRYGRVVTQVVVPGLAMLAAIIFASVLPGDVAGAMIYKSLPTRMLSLSLGAALAFREREGIGSLRHCAGPLLCGIVLLLAATLGRHRDLVTAGGWYWCLVLPGSSLACYGLVGGLLSMGPASPMRRLLSFRPLRYVGRISYGLYLYHLVFLYALGINEASLRGGSADAGRSLLALALTVGAAAVSFHAVERPLLRLRDRRRERGEFGMGSVA